MSCPDPSTFSAFVGGALAAAASEALELHVDACASCRIALSETTRQAVRASSPRLAPRPPRAGDRLGRYEVVGELGAGAMGVVYLARDPELDRELAIKLVPPQPGEAEDELVQLRTQREGRALARIDHPNVVRVLDVGRWGDALFVAMERAPGTTLRAWLAARPRSVREILDVFAQCAAGLHAAHAAGLVHRDVKPENVLVDADGRARVTDFGLARAVDAGNPAPATAPCAAPALALALGSGDPRLTRTRGVVGTPAYMAPEQHRGEPVGARADQFALCVALVEALTGARPFAGETRDARLASIAAIRVELPPGVPRRARRAIARGLAVAPADRFATMAELGAALGRSRSLAPWLTGGAAVITGAALAVAGVAAAFDRVNRAFAAPAWAYARDGVERYARRWSGVRTEVCRAATERGERAAPSHAVAVRCLDRRAHELDLVLARWEEGAVEVLASAPEALDGLAPVAGCLAGTDDVAANPAAAARLRAHAAALAAGRAELVVGRPREAAAQLAALDAALADAGFPALRAEVLLARAAAARELGALADARGQLIAAITEAEAARADHVRADGWLALAELAGDEQVRLEDAEDALRLARAIVTALGEPAELAARWEVGAGLVRLRQGAPHEAVAALRRSLASAAGNSPIEHARRLQILARALIAAGDPASALAELERAEAGITAALGPSAPPLVGVLNSMMEPLDYLGRGPEAVATGERALALAEASLGTAHPRRTRILSNLAVLLGNAGEHPRAIVLLEEVLRASIAERGADHHSVGVAHQNLASTLLDAERATDATPHLDRALAILSQTAGADHPVVANAHSALARAHLAQGDPAAAVRHARRALAIRERAQPGPGYLAYTRFELSQALAAAGQRGEAIATARAALALPLAATGREAALAEAIRAWLAAQPAR